MSLDKRISVHHFMLFIPSQFSLSHFHSVILFPGHLLRKTILTAFALKFWTSWPLLFPDFSVTFIGSFSLLKNFATIAYPDQTAPQEQSDLGMQWLFRLLYLNINVLQYVQCPKATIDITMPQEKHHRNFICFSISKQLNCVLMLMIACDNKNELILERELEFR